MIYLAIVISRLGRDYVSAGDCMDTCFPDHGIRTAVNDGIDSQEGECFLSKLPKF